MNEWEAFHAKVAATAPEGDVLAPRRFMVGVLPTNRDYRNEELCQHDFCWIRAHGKITIAKIREAYKAREPEVDVDLWFEGAIASPETMMKDLGNDDPVIALRAVEKPVRPAAFVLRSPSSNRALPPPSPTPVRINSQFASSAVQSKATETDIPWTPMSADKDTEVPPWDVLRDRERPSIEVPARTLTFTRANSTPLSAPPSSRPQSRPPGISIPSPTFAFHQPMANSSPHMSGPATGTMQRPGPTSPSTRAPLQDVFSELNMEPKSPLPTTIKPETTPLAATPVPDDAPLSQCFNPDDVFGRDPSPEDDPEESVQLVDRHIRNVINQQDVEVLEAGVARSIKILDKLKNTFSRFVAVSPDANAWIHSIDKLKESFRPNRTVVGVVGNTGAGKSSIINALLNEERLVPTNCMRACTAVVTEISWNYDDDPGHKYRAEIEFIDRVEWDRELKILMQEFLNENGTVAREASDANSDAGIAWTKFHAVYPKIHKDELDKWRVEKLMGETAVLNVLGTTKLINRARPEPFYNELQKYVDSKEKVTGKKDKEQQKQSKVQMEFWPLIKVVRLYTRSNALSTGAIVVDLPGVHDSNAARAAVAERYMKQCTGLWIVAPINRAVDDKAAKNLLGDTFKRQLKYDGNYSAVTFICSKTDDISIEEVRISLDLSDELAALEAKAENYQQEIEKKKEKIEDLREAADIYKATLTEIEDEIDAWEELKYRVDDGEVFAPRSKSNRKRKKRNLKKSPRKRRQIDDDSEVEPIGSDSDDPSNTENEADMDGNETPQDPLTMQDVDEKLVDLRTTRKNARREKKVAEDEIKELKPSIREVESKISEVDAQIRAMCIERRNKYSKGAIQQDFAAGIKELDQEAAIEADEEAFNPDEEIRDYDKVADSLPVFCVSSRAYQKMCGRLKRDGDVPGFRTQEETEIPQLQDHCKKLTEDGRIQASRTFLLGLCQQLTTLFLWASNDGTGLKMTDTEKRKQANYLVRKLEELEKGLEQAADICLGSMKTQLQDQIFERMNELVNDAVQSAPTIAESWGRHKNQGGLHWGTYKAIVRRGGAYHSATAGHHDFNAELLDPITKKLATGWERAFQQRLPRAFETHTKNAANVLHAFHTRIEERARPNGVGLANLAMLKGSIKTYEQTFKDLNTQLKARMTEAQRDANREFVPAIANIMMIVYDICTNESGTGSFLRMKNHMLSFVQQQSVTMFPAATNTVEQALMHMCGGLKEEMANKAREIGRRMRTDYMQVLGGVQAAQDLTNEPEQSLRSDVMAQLKEIDQQFERIASGDFAVDEERTEDVSNGIGSGIDREAEQQLQNANDKSASASQSGFALASNSRDQDSGSVSETPPTHGSVNGDETTDNPVDALHDTIVTEPSPVARTFAARRSPVNDNDEEDKEL